MTFEKAEQQFQKQGMHGLYTPEEMAAVLGEVGRLCAELSNSYKKGAESMRERVKAVVEKVGNNRCACVDRERCASCGTVDDILADVSALPLKENEG